MRWLGLYLRSRRIPAALVTAAAVAAASWSLWHAVSDRAVADVRFAALTIMLAVTALASTLGAPDPALDRTAAAPWPPRRAGHLALALLAVLAVATAARFEPVAVVLRDAAGLLGLAALGAVFLGAANAWIAPLLWTLVAVMPFMGPSADVRVQLAAWLIQPAATGPATLCALVLALSGALAYAWRGPR